MPSRNMQIVASWKRRELAKSCWTSLSFHIEDIFNFLKWRAEIIIKLAN